MHIEISAGGLSGMIATDRFLSDMDSYIKKADDVISSFATIKKSIVNLNGGPGTLQDAMTQVESRVALEKEKKKNAQAVKTKTKGFLDLAVRVDQKVAQMVNQNREEFYRVNPWLRPASDDRPWYEKVVDWIIDKGKDIFEIGKKIVSKVVEAAKWVADCMAKAWEFVKDVYNKKGVLWKIVNITGKVIGAALAVAGCVAALMVGSVCPAVGAVMILYAANTVINRVVDIVNIVNENYDQVGKVNFLKTLLTDSFSDFGEFLFGETGSQIGKIIGNGIYYIGEFVNIIGQLQAIAGKVKQAPEFWNAIKGGFSELKDAGEGIWYIISQVDVFDIPHQFALFKMTIPNLIDVAKCLNIIKESAEMAEKVIKIGINMITSGILPDFEVPSIGDFFDGDNAIFKDIKSVFDGVDSLIDKTTRVLDLFKTPVVYV